MSFSFAKRLWPSRSKRRSNCRPQTIRLSLERLEDRLVPSTLDIKPDFVLAAMPGSSAGNATPLSGPGNSGYTPAQIRQAYGFNQIAFQNGTVAGDGRGQTIAIVDAYNEPNLLSDVNTFNKDYGLPLFNSSNGPTLTRVNQSGGAGLPGGNTTWGVEESLDVEWAHAMAPKANILLVEANSNSLSDLLSAVQYASSPLNVSVVSMSWGGSFPGESNYDAYFTSETHSDVVFVASAGDQGVFLYPGSSPNVLAVGGTALRVNSSSNYVRETVWNDGNGWSSGGGPDRYYPTKPGPDVAYNADPNTGYAVYDTYGQAGWLKIGGTSAGAPQWSAIAAIADQGRQLNGLGQLNSYRQPSADQLQSLLRELPSFDFHQNIPGSNQYGYSGSAVVGLGTPYADRIVAGLAQEFDASATTFKAVAGQQFTEPIAYFSDFTHTVAAALVDDSGYIWWGDGTSSSGQVVSLGNGRYEVLGTHTYNYPGNYTNLPVEITGVEPEWVYSNISVTQAPPQGIGVFNPSTATWYLRYEDSSGGADAGVVQYGGAYWFPIVGDWDGSGNTSIGVVNLSTETWYLPGIAPFQYGAPGWVPVAGDWSGTGHTGIGVFNPSTATWYLRTEDSGGGADAGVFQYGNGSWIPVTGDWNGTGHTGIGMFDPSTATWYLRNEDSGGGADAGVFQYGAPGWMPVTGDWDGSGRTGIGVVDPVAGVGDVWYLRDTASPGAPDISPFAYGAPGWKPVSGDWNGWNNPGA